MPVAQYASAPEAKRVRLGAIGLGNWGFTLARAYSMSHRVEIRSCYSADLGQRRKFSAEFACEWDDSLDSLLSRPDIDGVVVTAQNNRHAAIIEAAVARNKHVFVEKPVAISAQDLKRIRLAVERSGVIFACGHAARRLSGVRAMKKLLDEGEIGLPTTAEAVFGNPRGLELAPENWRMDPRECPGGPLTQIGIHHIDTLQYLLGPVRRVAAMGRSPRREVRNELAVGVLLEFDAAIGYLNADWLTPSTFTIDMHCTSGRMRFELDYAWWGKSADSDAHSSLVKFGYADDRGLGERSVVREEVTLARGNYLCEEIEEFGAAIAGECAVEVGLDTAVLNVAVVHAAAQSLKSSQSVEVADLLAQV